MTDTATTHIMTTLELSMPKEGQCKLPPAAALGGKLGGAAHWAPSKLAKMIPRGHEFEQTPGDSEGQADPVCCSSRDPKESDTADGLNHHKLDERTCNEFSKTITQGKTQREFITLLDRKSNV